MKKLFPAGVRVENPNGVAAFTKVYDEESGLEMPVAAARWEADAYGAGQSRLTISLDHIGIMYQGLANYEIEQRTLEAIAEHMGFKLVPK